MLSLTKSLRSPCRSRSRNDCSLHVSLGAGLPLTESGKPLLVVLIFFVVSILAYELVDYVAAPISEALGDK